MSFFPAKKVLGIGIADSQLKWLGRVSSPFIKAGYRFDLICPADSSIPLDSASLAASGIETEPSCMALAAICDTDLCFNYSVIILIDSGSRLFKFYQRFDKACRRNPDRPRPVIITGYIGLVLEKHVEGFLWRTGADIILVNNRIDEEMFLSLSKRADLDTGSLLRCGLPLVEELLHRETHWPPRKVLFASQPHFPGSKKERLYILRKLVDYKAKYPDCNVSVKLRTKPEVRSFHPEKYHYEELAKEVTGGSELNFLYGSLEEHLVNTDLLVTVSSTALCESIASGIPSGVITDFGFKESIGTHWFLGSGLEISFAELIAGKRPDPKPEWMGQFLETFGETNQKILLKRVNSLLLRQARQGRHMRRPKAYYLTSPAGDYYR
jgi:hypothetical protein